MLALLIPGVGMGGGDGSVTPPVTVESGAGRSRRRRRYLVEIDGQEFEAADLTEVVALLDRAKQVVQEVAEEAESQPIYVGQGLPIEKPVIRTDSEDIKGLVSEYRGDIDAIYEQIAEVYRAREKALRAMLKDEEEAIIISLLVH